MRPGTLAARLIVAAALAACVSSLPHGHTMWGAEDSDNDWQDTVPRGLRLKTSQAEAKRAFGLDQDEADGNIFTGLERDAEAIGEVTKSYANRLWLQDGGTGSMGGHTKRAQQLHGMQRAAMGRGRVTGGGQALSHINQPDQGHNSGAPCPSYGLDLGSYLVAGGTGHYWRRTVEIRSQENEVVGIVKRGCPAWTNAFSWKVPKGHGFGCRIDVDPTVYNEQHKCQKVEEEVLYTDQWSGLLHQKVIRVIDCHDKAIFSMYEINRDVIIAGYMVHSNYVIESPTGEILGYCKLEGFENSLQAVSEHNFTFVDLEGNDVARAERPFHWKNGATEHVWNVTIFAPGGPGTIGDARAVLGAVVNIMLLDEETDWCSDIVFTITPVVMTLTAIGIIAGASALWSFIESRRNKEAKEAKHKAKLFNPASAKSSSFDQSKVGRRPSLNEGSHLLEPPPSAY